MLLINYSIYKVLAVLMKHLRLYFLLLNCGGLYPLFCRAWTIVTFVYCIYKRGRKNQQMYAPRRIRYKAWVQSVKVKCIWHKATYNESLRKIKVCSLFPCLQQHNSCCKAKRFLKMSPKVWAIYIHPKHSQTFFSSCSKYKSQVCCYQNRNIIISVTFIILRKFPSVFAKYSSSSQSIPKWMIRSKAILSL